jgi:hypothetical protein
MGTCGGTALSNSHRVGCHSLQAITVDSRVVEGAPARVRIPDDTATPAAATGNAVPAVTSCVGVSD